MMDYILHNQNAWVFLELTVQRRIKSQKFIKRIFGPYTKEKRYSKVCTATFAVQQN